MQGWMWIVIAIDGSLFVISCLFLVIIIWSRER